jgi:predicted Zn-ribbon and HTH transcriptional regulator
VLQSVCFDIQGLEKVIVAILRYACEIVIVVMVVTKQREGSMKTEKALKCKRCGYEWPQRYEREPKACPYCKSHKWREEKQK